AVDGQLAKGAQQPDHHVARGGAGEELRACDHRIEQAMLFRLELVSSAQMVDKDVGVDEEISHVPTCRGLAASRREPRRTSPREPSLDSATTLRGTSRQLPER